MKAFQPKITRPHAVRLKINTSILIVLAAISVSCNQLKLYNFDRGEILASVGDKDLYLTDVSSMIESGLPAEDSIKMLQTIVDGWVRKELKTLAAEARFSDQQHDIEEMVNQYRGALLGYKYEQEWLSNKLDTTVTTKQITEYYDANRDNFRLSGPIVKGRVARIPAGLRQSKKLEELFKSDKEENRNDFLNICQKNQYRIDDYSTQWDDFSTVVSHIPFTHSNFDEFLGSRKYYEVEDDQYKYMMAIESYRPTGDYSPIEREVNNIRKIILNKRQQALLATMEDSLYNDAVSKQAFEIKMKK